MRAGSSRSARRSNSTTSPANLFVAGFIGSPKMNLIAGQRRSRLRRRTPSASAPSISAVARDGGTWRGTVSVAEHVGSDTFLYVQRRRRRRAHGAGAGRNRAGAGGQVGLTPEHGRIHRFDDDGRALAAVKLKDKVALVTGGTGGIGRAIARRYAEEGATVALADLDAAAAERAAADIGNGAYRPRPRRDAAESIDAAVATGGGAARRHRHPRQQRRDLRHGADRRGDPRELRPHLRRERQGPVLHAAGRGAER